MNNDSSGKKLIVFFMEEMNSAYSGKENIKIVLIQRRTE
jgi:septum formation topological specificity factor MinE